MNTTYCTNEKIDKFYFSSFVAGKNGYFAVRKNGKSCKVQESLVHSYQRGYIRIVSSVR